MSVNLDFLIITSLCTKEFLFRRSALHLVYQCREVQHRFRTGKINLIGIDHQQVDIPEILVNRILLEISADKAG